MIRSLWKSLLAYCRDLGVFGWVIYIAGIGSVVTFAQALWPLTEGVRTAWLVAGLVCLAIAPFWAFHRMRLLTVRLQKQLLAVTRGPGFMLRIVKHDLRDIAMAGNDLKSRLLIEQLRNQQEPRFMKPEVDDWSSRAYAALDEGLGTPVAMEFLRFPPLGTDNLHVTMSGRVEFLEQKADEITEADVRIPPMEAIE